MTKIEYDRIYKKCLVNGLPNPQKIKSLPNEMRKNCFEYLARKGLPILKEFEFDGLNRKILHKAGYVKTSKGSYGLTFYHTKEYTIR